MTEQVVPRQPAIGDVDLGQLDWTRPADRPFVTPKRRRLTAARNPIVERVGLIHAAAPIAAVADLIVLSLVSVALDVVPAWFRIGYPLVAIVAGYLGRVYVERDSVQTRGVLWFPGRIVAPLSAVAAVPVALGLVGVDAAVKLDLAGIAALTGFRCLTWIVLLVARRRGAGLRRTLVIGDADQASTIWCRLVEFPEAGLLPVQLLTSELARFPGAVQRSIAELDVEHVVLAATQADDSGLATSLPRHADNAPFFSVVPPLSELFLDPHSVTEVGGIPLIPLGRPTRLRQRFPGKRILDLLVSGALLLCSLPVLVACAIAIKLDDGGPVFFRQARVGRDGKLFEIIKFRTMVVGADRMLDELKSDNITDGLLFKLRQDPRITPVGRFMRRTSLDELPQLWNVLRGQMSMVGPRPLAVEPHDFSPGDAERHSVVPGITGYWQLSGGPELTYAEMIRLDLAYLRNWSIWLDLRLILRTVPALLHRHGGI